MGFPVVKTTTTTADSAATTSHTVNLPASIQNGDLLVVLLATVTTSPGTTSATGWTFLTLGANGTASFLQVGFKHATGTEGATVAIATTGSCRAAWLSYRIAGGDQGFSVPQGTAATGTSAAAAPPSLTPAWGIWDTLWLAICSSASATVPSAAPAGFSSLLTVAAGTNSIGAATLASRTATESPGTFTNANAAWVAQTIGIQPAVGVIITDTLGEHMLLRYWKTVEVTGYHCA